MAIILQTRQRIKLECTYLVMYLCLRAIDKVTLVLELRNPKWTLILSINFKARVLFYTTFLLPTSSIKSSLFTYRPTKSSELRQF